jgi:hypothetical protein
MEILPECTMYAAFVPKVSLHGGQLHLQEEQPPDLSTEMNVFPFAESPRGPEV